MIAAIFVSDCHGMCIRECAHTELISSGEAQMKEIHVTAADLQQIAELGQRALAAHKKIPQPITVPVLDKTPAAYLRKEVVFTVDCPACVNWMVKEMSGGDTECMQDIRNSYTPLYVENFGGYRQFCCTCHVELNPNAAQGAEVLFDLMH